MITGQRTRMNKNICNTNPISPKIAFSLHLVAAAKAKVKSKATAKDTNDVDEVKRPKPRGL